MISKEKIERINELAAKAKTEEGLTEAETKERTVLRREYIEATKASLRGHLDNVQYLEDLPPEEQEKYKKS